MMTQLQLAQQMLRAAKRMKSAKLVTASSSHSSDNLFIRVESTDGAVFDVVISTRTPKP